jgi:signal transduction histidine kinase
MGVEPRNSRAVTAAPEERSQSEAAFAVSDEHARLEDALVLAAHEIRTPLLAAKAAVERVLMAPGSTDAWSLLSRLVEGLDTLAHDLSGLLEWASGVRNLELEPLHVRWVVEEAMKSLGFAMDRSRVVVSGGEGLLVMADRRAMRVALSNLIRNALAYSPQGSPVEVRVAVRDGLVWITVANSGPGISPVEHTRVFEPFSRGRNGNGWPGSGLGLYIVRRVVDAHDGRLLLESDGAGTAVTIALAGGRTLS